MLSPVQFVLFQTSNILKYLFPVPKDDSQRVVSFINWDDWLLFRQHTYKKVDGGKEYSLTEIGPRFSMKRKHVWNVFVNMSVHVCGLMSFEFCFTFVFNVSEIVAVPLTAISACFFSGLVTDLWYMTHLFLPNFLSAADTDTRHYELFLLPLTRL